MAKLAKNGCECGVYPLKSIRIATRKSPLALWQAEYVAERLKRHWPGLSVTLVPMTTKGDKILDTPLAKVGGKGLFVKELERALLDREADIAVHSMKDVPMEFPDGLGIIVVCQRETPNDAWVSKTAFTDLPQGAVVGTSSLRRKIQLRRLRPDLTIRDLRGNVGTRLAKLEAGDYDGIILAAAGLKRLGLEASIHSVFSTEDFIPAVGQGAIGVEARVDDARVANLLAPLHCAETADLVSAERAFNARLNGGCQVPIAAHAVLSEKDKLVLTGMVGRESDGKILRERIEGRRGEAEAMGVALAELLLKQGADDLLKGITL